MAVIKKKRMVIGEDAAILLRVWTCSGGQNESWFQMGAGERVKRGGGLGVFPA